MNIAIIGYGKMGKEIEKALINKGHSVSGKYDSSKELNEIAASNDICIDFTSPDAFKQNYSIISEKFGGAIVGTTGWNDIEGKVIGMFKHKNKGLIYAGNFSIGVNIFFDVVEKAAAICSRSGYVPKITELHHKEKKDAPSGTARSIENIMSLYYKQDIPVSSVREGDIKGIHEVEFISGIDKISLKHEAFSRAGFAQGAVMAAEWLTEQKGIWDFRELLKLKLSRQENGDRK